MTTTPLDVHDDVLTRQAYEAIVASKGFGRPWWRSPSYEETLVEWRHVDEAERMTMWTVLEDGAVAGVATLWLPLNDNTTKAWLDVQVHPDHRRRGHGSALLDTVLTTAREAGRVQAITDFFVPPESEGHGYRRFAERHGFALSNTEIHRHLDLPVDATLLDRLDAESRPGWEGGYRLETHVDGVPEALRQSLCDVMNQLAVDAPTGDLEFEPESLTPERYEEYLGMAREQGRVRLTTVALDEATGEVVAYTDLILPSGAPTRAWQWGTLVHRDHRGHRLGMAVKLENLRRLQADHPQRDRIVTGNDDTNRWMVAVNEQLGFRIHELCPAYQRSL